MYHIVLVYFNLREWAFQDEMAAAAGGIFFFKDWIIRFLHGFLLSCKKVTSKNNDLFFPSFFIVKKLAAIRGRKTHLVQKL